MGMKLLSLRSEPWQGFPVSYFQAIAGGLILATVLVGSFLWGYGKRQKKAQAKPEFVSSCQIASARGETVKSEFIQVVEAPPASVILDLNWTAHFNDMVFDPESDYAQVLAEARKQLSKTSSQNDTASKCDQETYGTCRFDAGRPAHATTANSKSPKPWKFFLFWQRGKKADMESSHGSFSTPQHPSFRPPREKGQKLKRGKSGPIYTDGLSLDSNGFQKSAPMGSSALFCRKDEFQSPYEPLKHSSRPSSRTLSGALYTVS